MRKIILTIAFLVGLSSANAQLKIKTGYTPKNKHFDYAPRLTSSKEYKFNESDSSVKFSGSITFQKGKSPKIEFNKNNEDVKYDEIRKKAALMKFMDRKEDEQ